MNYKIVVGDNIRGFRHKLNWSQEKLAARTKLTNDYISRVELAKEGMSISSLIKIATALKVEPHQLLIKDSYKSD
jgi:transcriptional regulator with XRE-family HTH domain